MRWQRHLDAAEHLYARLEDAGLEMIVAPEHRLSPLTLVRIPDGVDDAEVRGRLLTEQNIELGAGLGKFAGSKPEHGAVATLVYLLRILQKAIDGDDEHADVGRPLAPHH